MTEQEVKELLLLLRKWLLIFDRMKHQAIRDICAWIERKYGIKPDDN